MRASQGISPKGIVGNLLTGVVAAVLWLLFLASLLSGIHSAGPDTEGPAAQTTGAAYQPAETSTSKGGPTKWPSAKGRKLSPPDAIGCIKELAEEAGNHC